MLGEADADAVRHPVLLEFARVAALCNDAVLRSHADEWHAEGDPMEGALLALAGKISGCRAAAVPRLDAPRRDPLRCRPSLHGRARQ